MMFLTVVCNFFHLGPSGAIGDHVVDRNRGENTFGDGYSMNLGQSWALPSLEFFVYVV